VLSHGRGLVSFLSLFVRSLTALLSSSVHSLREEREASGEKWIKREQMKQANKSKLAVAKLSMSRLLKQAKLVPRLGHRYNYSLSSFVKERRGSSVI
jgi:hypothetical protein